SNPARVFWRCRARGDVSDINRQLERKMREHMAHDASGAAPGDFFLGEKRSAGKRIALIEVFRPRGGRHFRHTAKKSFGRTCAYKHKTVGAQRHESAAATQIAFAFWRLFRKHFGIAALVRRTRIVPWAKRTSGLLRRT